MKKISYSILFLSIIGTCIIYPKLPAKIPVHWNLSGHVNSIKPKIYIFITALLPLLLIMLNSITRRIGSRDKNANPKIVEDITTMVMVLLLCGLNWGVIFIGLGYKFNFPVVIRLAVGFVLVIIGNYCTISKPNYFFGFRNKYTLSNETVWKKANRRCGYLLVLIGILTIATNKNISIW
jgi:uncharacterized membrane protein